MIYRHRIFLIPTRLPEVTVILSRNTVRTLTTVGTLSQLSCFKALHPGHHRKRVALLLPFLQFTVKHGKLKQIIENVPTTYNTYHLLCGATIFSWNRTSEADLGLRCHASAASDRPWHSHLLASALRTFHRQWCRRAKSSAATDYPYRRPCLRRFPSALSASCLWRSCSIRKIIR